MKKIFALLLLSALLINSESKAQDYKTALGVRLSTAGAVVNNSVTFKYFLNETSAVEALFTFSDPVAIGALFEKHKAINSTEGLKWFYGAGGYIGFSKPSVLAGAMGVAGLDYKFKNIPLNLTLDWKPELNIISDINFEPAAIGMSVRFTFGAR